MALESGNGKVNLVFMDAIGNRFLLVDEYSNQLVDDSVKSKFVRKISDSCGFDPDSVLFLSKPDKGDVMMRIFDRDGTEETMCGNGLRCIANYAFANKYIGEKSSVNTLDGIKGVQVLNGTVRTNFGEVKKYKEVNPDFYFAYPGLPHIVAFFDNLGKVDAEIVARGIRYDTPLTTRLGYLDNMHVNLVEVAGRNAIKIVTYEACVERITQACGTGAVASAYVAGITGRCKFPMKVFNPGGVLEADKEGNDMILTGPAKVVGKSNCDLAALLK